MPGPRCEPIDPAIAQELYEAHRPAIRRLLRGIVGKDGPVDDLLQQVFMRLLEASLPVGTAPGKAWLSRVAVNEALQQKRRRTIARRAEDELQLRIPVASEGSADSELQRDELVSAAWHAVQELPKEQREVLTMRIRENKSYATIADELGIPLGTALSRMKRALDRLRRRVSP